MRIFKGFLKVGIYLVALSGCQDAMKGNEIYPTKDNLREIGPDRLNIMGAKDTDGNIELVVAESPSHSCNVKIYGSSLIQGVSGSSLLESGKIEGSCLWDGEQYVQSQKHHTVISVNINHKILIDLQLYNYNSKKYLALSAFGANQTYQEVLTP